jgi:hypothetical protein
LSIHLVNGPNTEHNEGGDYCDHENNHCSNPRSRHAHISSRLQVTQLLAQLMTSSSVRAKSSLGFRRADSLLKEDEP